MRLMLDCAAICQTAINFIARLGSPRDNLQDVRRHLPRVRAQLRRWATCRTAWTRASAARKAASGWRGLQPEWPPGVGNLSRRIPPIRPRGGRHARRVPLPGRE